MTIEQKFEYMKETILSRVKANRGLVIDYYTHYGRTLLPFDQNDILNGLEREKFIKIIEKPKKIPSSSNLTDKWKLQVFEDSEITKLENESTTFGGKPYILVEKGQGYFKFQKHGKNIKIGKKDSRHFRLLVALCEPHFGVHKTVSAIFEAIRLSKDATDTRLNDPSLTKARKLELIGFAKKALQKINELQGKIIYKFDNQKNNMWIELEG